MDSTVHPPSDPSRRSPPAGGTQSAYGLEASFNSGGTSSSKPTIILRPPPRTSPGITTDIPRIFPQEMFNTNPTSVPSDVPRETTRPWSPRPTATHAITACLEPFLEQMYLHLLLRLPLVYKFRVVEIFEDSELTLAEIKEIALETAFHGKRYRLEAPLAGLPPRYKQLEKSWNVFVDSLLRDWNTYNIVSALFLSAILTILQIDVAAQDPLIRYSLLFSQICALISLLLGCLFSIRFDSNMRKTYKAAEWALEAKKLKTNPWWNIWIMLAMPAVWLAWSAIFYLTAVMSFVWRTTTVEAHSPPSPLSAQGLLAVRLSITLVLGLGVTTGGLSLVTFRHYGRRMDKAWSKRIQMRAPGPAGVLAGFHPAVVGIPSLSRELGGEVNGAYPQQQAGYDISLALSDRPLYASAVPLPYLHPQFSESRSETSASGT